ncbi:MAG TPA: efflux transporter outer membrane subunit [Planctomycetota bacterium]|jgi:multidrug efflux system outer membrane protein|nr:efflux transporter outer membrane subunit [Planctomycetota bacterium]OQC21659.1 MAG: Outer membrane protein OprM precursor [Planctomycetes bacterium ADurb.Bin069]HNU26466.1 efflux transporter outer membrane subunit [Planctomycetota bacterium]HOE29628.1 efflux transporter outer membrane subunit [Planctomycetota bacterium]HOE87359.1 efflux transporter outer membrane subunit [Planctomycetota bacterium]
MSRYSAFLLGAALAFAGGCTLAPEYERPAAPVPDAWPDGQARPDAADGREAPLATELAWREFVADARLAKLIETALAGNRDLRTAALNVERARAYYGVARAELWPAVDAAAGGSKQRIPAGVMGFGQALEIERYDVNLGVSSWEIDFFGRIRSLKERALQEFLATEHARRGARIALVAEVAGVYLTLAADRESLALAEATLETQQAACDLIRRRFEVGLATELDFRRAQTTVEAARVDIAFYTRLVAQGRNALNLLAGAPVPEELLPAGLGDVVPPVEISPGVSSEVLLLRPDVLQAESGLKAANADIGVARAAFFPRISLTGAIGTASDELKGLFESGSEAWNYGGRIVWPIFDLRTWSALDVMKAQRELAVARYEKAVQAAFREVADALAARGTVAEQLAAQEALVAAVAETHRLADTRYAKGIDSFLGVLDAQRTLNAARQGLIALRLAKLVNRVRLYAVLGGGGDEAAPPEGDRA